MGGPWPMDGPLATTTMLVRKCQRWMASKTRLGRLTLQKLRRPAAAAAAIATVVAAAVKQSLLTADVAVCVQSHVPDPPAQEG